MRPSVTPWLLFATVCVAALITGYHLGERQGLFVGFLFSCLVFSYAFFLEEQMLLKTFRHNAVEGQDAWGLLELVDDLAKRAKVLPPQIHLLDLDAPTAAALGKSRRNGHILLSQGLLERLNYDELRSVVAVLVCQIGSQQTFSKMMGTTISLLILLPCKILDLGLSLVFRARAPRHSIHFFQKAVEPFAILIQKLSSGRGHYFSTDKRAAELIQSAETLAHTLWKLDSLAAAHPFQIDTSEAHLFIVNPLTWKERDGYLQRQPSVEKRIKNLIGRYPV